MSYVEDLEAVTIHQERVAELHGDATRVVDFRRSDAGGNFGLQGIFQAHNRQSGIAEHISVNSGDGDTPSAVELSFGIESQRNGARRIAIAGVYAYRSEEHTSE